MRLPSMPSGSAQWPVGMVAHWSEITKRVAAADGRAGKSTAYDNAKRALELAIDRNNKAAFEAALSRPRPATRALIDIWLESPERRKKSLSPGALQWLAQRTPRISRLAANSLLILYFREFDQLGVADGGSELRVLVENALKVQLARYPLGAGASTGNALETLRSTKFTQLSLDGPRLLADDAHKRGQELRPYLEHLGLMPLISGRYDQALRGHYFLKTLQALPIGENHPVLAELSKPEAHTAPFDDRKRIGHRAVEMLIDRSTDDPGPIWREFIMGICGDPRIARTSTKYQSWWRLIGTERADRVQSWLSRQDVQAFIDAITAYGEESNKADLQRMFPLRKKILEGLLEGGHVRASRLFLGAKAKMSVARILDHDLNVPFGALSSELSDKALIFLDCKDFYILEGSHSFKLWVYLKPPPGNLLSFERRTPLRHYELTEGLAKKFVDEYGDIPRFSIAHHKGYWEHHFIYFLFENGIEVDVEQLLTPESYQALVSFSGLPVLRRPPPANSPLTKAERQILLALQIKQPRMARAIAAACKLELSEVNSALHNRLAGRVRQLDDFSWELTGSGGK
jgi:hypothetical protein